MNHPKPGLSVPEAVRAGIPTVWRNPHVRPVADVLPTLPLQWSDVQAAQVRWRRFAPLLAKLFPELRSSGGLIDSALLEPKETFARAVLGGEGRLLVKADHDLPVTGCIKARGGVYEVLWYAERVAQAFGVPEDFASFADPAWRERFARHTIVVGSTGNLGFSVGVMARALCFAAEVHMSSDAKAWKKDRLRRIGVNVVEHAADYTAAVAAARSSAATRPQCHFVDDETSEQLFLGYATAAIDLRTQLEAARTTVDAGRPLLVYLPCGVGGAPGGITFGLKHVFGDAVRCVFVEPVESPCMLVQLASGSDASVSVYDIGRTNQTVQDGLAVASASLFAAEMVRHLVDGVVTVSDATSLEWMRRAWPEDGLKLEPSAASALAAAASWTRAGSGTDIVWTTGGGLLPDDVFQELLNESPTSAIRS
jgi:D-serine dehydratase